MRRRGRRRKREQGTRTALLAGGFVLLLVIAVYLGIGVYYTGHFVRDAAVNGIDVSGRTVEEAEALVNDAMQDYTLTITERGGAVEQIRGEEVGVSYTSDGSLSDVLRDQNAFFWLFSSLRHQDYTAVLPLSYDRDRLLERMLQLSAFDSEKVTMPRDACIEETEDGYVIVPEVEGDQLDPERTFSLFCQALEEGRQEIRLEEEGCYRSPERTSEDDSLQLQLASYQKYWNLTIVYDMGDCEEVLDERIFSAWMNVADDGTVTFDEDAVAAWVSEFAGRYNTLGSVCTFHTSLGEDVYVQNMSYGWKMDEEAETAWLVEALAEGQDQTREPEWSQSAFARNDDNDLGDTYVEIDITNQRMWFYKDGVLLVDTPVVTGDVAKEYDTPLGVYAIFSKEEKAILKGADNLSGENYNTPVDYWMPFNGGVGIHDAKWRSSFGGTIYQASGSHGCVNTPWSQAQIIYENADVGTPVVVYAGTISDGRGAQTVWQPVETRVIDANGEEVFPDGK